MRKLKGCCQQVEPRQKVHKRVYLCSLSHKKAQASRAGSPINNRLLEDQQIYARVKCPTLAFALCAIQRI